MKVLLLKDLEGTRHSDNKAVTPGYPRKYLFPKHLAVVADERTIEQVRRLEEAARRRTENALDDAREIAQRIRKLTVTVYAKAGEAGRLFGTVTNADVATQLKREAGIDVDKRKIEIEPPIRSLGPHEVRVELHAEITETLKIVVAAQ